MKLNIFKENTALKNIFLTISIITGFIFIVTFSSLYVSDAIKNNNACGCVIPIPFMILILSSLGVFVGSISYYFIASKYIKEKKSIDENIEFTLNFLLPDERAIVKELIKNKPGLKQTELEKLTGFHKVKIHRIIERLKAKSVIEKINDGKIRRITLNKGLVKIFE
ncbi:MAG: hypothetical protein KAT77_05255 [Nanoarchaeota archaeon]|nr:hypothetical protein [Nanoarchaeota archaeon]